MFLKGLNALGPNLTERNFPILTENYLVMWEMVKYGLGIVVLDGILGDRVPLVCRVLCHSARGPDADRHHKQLKWLTSAGSSHGAD
jgi:hypothetical protein